MYLFKKQVHPRYTPGTPVHPFLFTNLTRFGIGFLMETIDILAAIALHNLLQKADLYPKIGDPQVKVSYIAEDAFDTAKALFEKLEAYKLKNKNAKS